MRARAGAWRTLRELDAQAGARKGTAFRAFKQLSAGWVEGRDYRVLAPERDGAEFDALRAQGRLYGSSRVAILIEAAASVQLAQFIASGKGRE